MVRIIFYADNELLLRYQEERKKDLFEVIVNALVKELGDDGVGDAYADAGILTADIDCDSSFEDIRGFIYDASQLNDEDSQYTRMSIFKISTDPSLTSMEEEAKRQRGSDFAKRVDLLHVMREELEKTVLGQTHAVNQMATGLLNAYLKGEGESSPLETFTLMGPSGCGKSLLAEETARLLYEIDGTKYKILNVADYESNGTYDDIISFVYNNPRCVLVFNNLLKCEKIGGLIVSALTTGECDSVSFRNAIMIFTTNAGASIYNSSFTGNLSNISEEALNEAIDSSFVSSIANELKKGKKMMLSFAPQRVLKSSASSEIRHVLEDFSSKTNIETECELDDIATAILYMNKGSYNVPTIRENAKKLFERELADLFSQVDYKEGLPLLCMIKKIKLELSLKGAEDSTKELFAKRDLRTLVVCDKSSEEYFKSLTVENVAFETATTAKEAKEIIKNGVDFVLLDVLTGAKKSSNLPTDLEDYKTQGTDVYEYIETYFREIPLYLISDTSYGIYKTAYMSFLNNIARDIIYFDDTLTEEVSRAVRMIHEEIELSRDLAKLIDSEKVLTYKTKQILSKDGRTLTIQLGGLALENAERAIVGRYLTSYLSSFTFDDVIGHESAKRVLRSYASFLTQKGDYFGNQQPRGFLIYGYEGLGKSLLAKALAGETNSTLVSYDASDVIFEENRLVDPIVKRIKEMFKHAKQSAPAVLLIEDADKLLLANEEISRALTGELDALNKNKKQPVLVVATTSRDKSDIPSKIAEHFDRLIGVFFPNKDERRTFIKRYLAKNNITSLSDEAIENFVTTTYYWEYRQIKTILDFAVRNARGKKLTDVMLIDAADLYEEGEETGSLTGIDLEATAYHEMGHYLIGYLLGGRPSYVTIVSRGYFLGYTRGDMREGDTTTSKRELLDRICVCLGGRAAEVLMYGEEGLTGGASSDLNKATRCAKNVVCYLAMDEFLYTTHQIENENSIPEAMLKRIDEILHEQYERTLKLLSENKDKLEALTRALIKKKSLTGDECERIMSEL